MAFWLFKEEPTHYSFADLERDGETAWDGISNALALQYLRQVRPGDTVAYYHTGNEKAIVGVLKVVAAEAGDDRNSTVRVRPVRRLQSPVTLGQLKADPALASWELLRLPRLSVVPVTPAQWARIEELSRGHGNGPS
jgi:predicted RNA-binding protein with PUA-like domain